MFGVVHSPLGCGCLVVAPIKFNESPLDGLSNDRIARSARRE
jgi:hypothetical protein